MHRYTPLLVVIMLALSYLGFFLPTKTAYAACPYTLTLDTRVPQGLTGEPKPLVISSKDQAVSILAKLTGIKGNVDPRDCVPGFSNFSNFYFVFFTNIGGKLTELCATSQAVVPNHTFGAEALGNCDFTLASKGITSNPSVLPPYIGVSAKLVGSNIEIVPSVRQNVPVNLSSPPSTGGGSGGTGSGGGAQPPPGSTGSSGTPTTPTTSSAPGSGSSAQPTAYATPQNLLKKTEQSLTDVLCTPESSGGQGNVLYFCINRIYKVTIAIGGIGAVVFIVVAGYLYMTGGHEQISTAKSMIGTSFIGIFILVSSHLVLRSINPVLVQFRPITPREITDPGQLLSPAEYANQLKATGLADAGFDGKDIIQKGSGSLRACGREFKDPSAESSNIKPLTVKVWNEGGKETTKTINVHDCVRDRFARAFEAYFNSGQKFPIAGDIGSYNVRNVTGSTVLSAHSFGLAIDVNASVNCHASNDGKCISGGSYEPGKNPQSITVDSSLVKAMQAQGIGWGGNWDSSKDYMHFSCTANEKGSC